MFINKRSTANYKAYRALANSEMTRQRQTNLPAHDLAEWVVPRPAKLLNVLRL